MHPPRPHKIRLVMAADAPLPELFSELLLSTSGGEPDHSNGAGAGGQQAAGWGTDRPGGPGARPGPFATRGTCVSELKTFFIPDFAIFGDPQPPVQ